MKKLFLLSIMVLSLAIINGCAKDAEAENDIPVDSPTSTDSESRTNLAEGVPVWAAFLTFWTQPVPLRTIEKEFTSEIACWNHYEGGVGESLYGTQSRDHQGNLPTKGFHFGPDYLNYPIRTYAGKGQGVYWLTCDEK